ncbi:MAG TPA: polyphenol oxidase family protein [Gemmatimonadota bacterium]|nr:polyphenol oxidase family protein [Gemmatimonadota bacterium]
MEERFVGGELPRVEAALADGLISAVTTRPLDFGLHTDTPAREVSAAHRALRAWAGERFGIVVGGSQVHGARLFLADGARVPEPAGRQAPATLRVANYDGFLAARPGILLTVGVADCVPAFLAAPARGALALLHAGWRGAAAEIVPRAVTALGELGVEPGEIRAWWGPAIGPCCYPVGDEVVRALEATAAGRDPGAWRGEGGEGPARVDLRAALTLQAVAAGLPPDAVSSSPLCTSCDARLHSYRRQQGGGGRMLAMAGWVEGER